jgi:hypothetical protein
MPTEELFERIEIRGQKRAVAVKDVIARFQRDTRQMLARHRIADQQVMLHALHAHENVPIRGGNPADTETG